LALGIIGYREWFSGDFVEILTTLNRSNQLARNLLQHGAIL